MSGWLLYGLVLGLVLAFDEGSPVVATIVVVALGSRFVFGAIIALARGHAGLVPVSLILEALALVVLWPVLVYESSRGLGSVWPWGAFALLLAAAASWVWRRARAEDLTLRTAEAASRDEELLSQWFYLWLPARS